MSNTTPLTLREDPSPPSEPLDHGLEENPVFPLSFAQRRLWFLDQLEPNSPLYNITMAARLEGPLDPGVLQRALTAITERHEVLRTTYGMEEGEPVQVIRPPCSLLLPLIDLSGLPAAERELEAARWMREEAGRSFHLQKDLPLRVHLLRLGPTEHLLTTLMHHIACDGWSIGVFLQELATLYEAFRQGQPSPLSELPIQYADFAAWQHEGWQEQELAEQLAYWKKQLAGAPVLLELPADHGRPPIQSHRGAKHPVRIRPAVTDNLKTLARQEGCTLFMVLLGALQTLLVRYTSQPDIVIGSPIANRTRTELEGLIGSFVNMLALRTDLSGNPTFRQLLHRVREVTLGAYAHQDLPFEKLVDELQLPRNQSASPLFQITLALQNTPLPRTHAGDLRVTPFELDNGTTKFDLSLFLWETAEGLTGWLEYTTDLFDAPRMARMEGHFRTLLEAIAANPDQPLSRLPLLTPAEQDQLLLGWNQTENAFAREQCVHELFEAEALRRPEAVAVACGREQITYGQLNERANQLAHQLRSLGIGPDSLVGVCTERSITLVVGLLGVLKAGGAYVPLDPGYPPERLAFMLQDAEIPVLLTQEKLLASLPRCQARIICLDGPATRTASSDPLQPSSPPLSDVTPGHLAYLIYTSGSTGTPKGVQIQHDSLLNLVAWHQRTYQLTAADRATQLASPAFDASVWELWPYLTCGASIHIPDEETRLSPLQLADWLCAQQITVCFLPTPLAEAILGLPWPANCRLRALLTGGDRLRRAPQSKLPFRLINHYGPTENTVVTTAGIVEPGAEAAPAPSIGRPIDNTQVYILDPNLQPVPVGVPGELHAGGVGLARGYLKRPALTAEKFIPHPFSALPGARLYKTGDLVRYLEDGNIDYLGRIDHQVKIRGNRIELGEIETVLGQCPLVREVVVVAQPNPTGESRLVAYFVPAQNEKPGSGPLRDFLKERLPEYMVPAFFIPLEAMPLSPNGKVDRKALPPPDAARLESERDYLAPRTQAEKSLAKIWAEVLRLEQVGIRDNFFEIGGDSILSIQIISRAHQEGLRLTPKQLFQHQTIEDLARVAGTNATAAVEQGLVSGTVILTPIQRWFFEQDFAGPHHWNQAVLLEVRRGLDPGHLETALQHLVMHHDALRMRYQPHPPWSQEYASTDTTSKLSNVDLSQRPSNEQAAAMQRTISELQSSLDLAQGPLLKAALFDLGAARPGRLVIVAHHLVVDGVSWRILLEDLNRTCDQLSRQQPIQLQPKTTSFQHWAGRLADYARSPELENETGYWLEVTRGSETPLPLDSTEGADLEESAQSVATALEAEETRALLQQAPQAYNTQINDILLAALGRTLRHWTGARTFLIHLEGHGREELFEGIDLSRTIGWFTAMFPVRLELPEIAGAGDLLKSIKEQLRAIPNRGLGYGLLRYSSGNEAAMAQLRSRPEPPIAFNYLGQFDQVLPADAAMALLGETPEPLHSPKARRVHLLEINCAVLGGRLSVNWTYSRNRHRPETVERLGRIFLEELRGLIRHCLEPQARGWTPSDFPLAKLDQATLDGLLRQHPDPEDVYPLSPMQRLFLTLAGGRSEVGFEQFCFTLHGPLDPRAFHEAWQALAQRHPVLRTALVAEDLEEPVQLVYRQIAPRLEQHDWRPLTPEQQADRMKAFLRGDRQRGFDLSQPPLMRLTLLRTGDESWRFVWSFHHLLLDGWSWPLVFQELARLYQPGGGTRPLEGRAPRPYRDYIAWLQKRDLSAAKDYWVQTLQGHAPAVLCHGNQRPASAAFAQADYQQEERRLKAPAAAALQNWAREQQLTLNICAEAAWALVLSHETGQPDVVFGSTVSGRPPELAGVESMIGLFINNLPRRVVVAPEESLLSWLRRLQQQQLEMREFEFAPLLQIQQWSGLPWHARLFDSLVVFQNYQMESLEQMTLGSAVRVTDLDAAVRTNYPVTLIAVPQSGLWLQLVYDGHQLPAAAASRFLDSLERLLEGMAADPSQPVSRLLSLLPPVPRDGTAARSATRGASASRPRKIVPPGDDLEQRLTQMWERALGVQPIGITDNFFDLGGHSLPAVWLFQEIKKAFGKHLPMVTLFQAPTVQQLAEILRQENWTPPWSSLVAIKSTGTKPPFYCVHGVGGNILEYLDLAKYVEADQPFYGLQAVGLDGKRPWLQTVEEMAAHYITEIKSLQPDGPYYLGGSSYGGLVAYEMAQQLYAQGEEVAVLAFFDTYAPGYPKLQPTTSILRKKFNHFRTRLSLHWGNLRVAKGRQKWDYIQAKALKLQQRQIWRYHRLKRRLRQKAEQLIMPAEIRKTRKSGQQAAYTYVPVEYPGQAILFRASEQPTGIIPDPTLGWSSLIKGGLEIYHTPGHHGAIVREPRVQILAQQLAECLAKAHQKKPARSAAHSDPAPAARPC